MATEVEQLEQQRKNAQETIRRSDAALRLAQNADFRELFIEGYFLHEAARLVQLSGDPALTVDQRADALAMAQATGHTKRYLSVINQMAIVAERDMEELEETLEEARQEEDERQAQLVKDAEADIATRNSGQL